MQAPNCHSHQLQGDDTARYMLAGRATVSVLNRQSGNHFTYRITMPTDEATGRRSLWFVRVLTGPHNENDYQYLGYIRQGLYRHGARKSKIAADAQSAQVFAWLWPRVMEDALPPCIEIWHSGACGRCGRTLTDPLSIETGLGPVCREQVEAAGLLVAAAQV